MNCMPSMTPMLSSLPRTEHIAATCDVVNSSFLLKSLEKEKDENALYISIRPAKHAKRFSTRDKIMLQTQRYRLPYP
jgi:hypothetical protein